ncbi:serine/threonine-protein kinase/endoribonuclease IRE1-like isoform X2 [Clavelina lepadiformis]|uniref:serine/threonine-protein kinase/endoribonuclease IRE1-like isoform X2 n=1 Tax=Clavelina lepadiformis TaxID=159417 RepID=UPI004042858A
MLVFKRLQLWFTLGTILISVAHSEQNESNPSPTPTAPPSKELQPKDPLLLISTLDGTLHAVSKRTGIVQWKLDEGPVLHVPMESATTIKGPTFLPDPHDGSLYAYDPSSQGLTKLPFTIPELVQASPCKSSDGILYTGRKQDVWYAINPLNGVKQQIITTDSAIDKCPGGSGDDMFIGRTEYKITMFDSKTNVMRWNVTFTDYSSHANEKVSNNYELLHLASSTDGFVITVERETGRILWAQNYGYPVVAMYAWVPEGLQKIEMTSVAKETMTYLLQQAEGKISYWDTIFEGNPRFQPKEATLVPTLYVGQYQHSLYALPAMTHDGVQLNKHRNVHMLPGPPGSNHKSTSTDLDVTSITVPVWRLLGYHKVPPYSKISIPQTYHPSSHHIGQIGRDQPKPEQMSTPGFKPNALPTSKPPVDDKKDTPSSKMNHGQAASNENNNVDEDMGQIRWNEITMVAILTSLITGAFILCLLKKSSIGLSSSNTSKHYDGLIHVGRITVDPIDILGRGSEGTIVYRGRFDGRNVAVKRVVPECFTFADREVALLRESDEHSHVVRYFCMERDTQFQYIALELCSNTLQEYVENPQYKCSTGLGVTTVLHQAMMGLDHLHSIKIVHRDVKPSNILISVPGKLGKQRVVISDFGLCKKLIPGRLSFSHRSGKAGTDGWIAPEMILDKRYRMVSKTQAVDIFSMGCVFYYVICGKHPFGDSISRQARIINGDYSLEELQVFENAEEAIDLIRRMLVIDPSLRPKSDTILKHPLFWDSVKKLQFFEDVSDRIEKEPLESITMQQIDKDSFFGVRNGIQRDWIQHLCPPLQDDLHKFRAYKAGSVRDLLRAIRNKKHHYRELPTRVKQSLGSVPDEYLHYFTSRFPRLLIHSYLAIACCRHEPMFRAYYGESAGDHLFDDAYQSEDISDNPAFNKPTMYGYKPGWKMNKHSSPLTGDWGVRARVPKNYSLADQDPDWRSTSTKFGSTQPQPTNAFKSLSKNTISNRLYNNGYTSNLNRSFEDADGRVDRHGNSRENCDLDFVEITESHTTESSKQLIFNKRLTIKRGSPRVSESSTGTNETETSERSSVKSNNVHSVRQSNTKSSFAGSYAEAVTRKSKALTSKHEETQPQVGINAPIPESSNPFEKLILQEVPDPSPVSDEASSSERQDDVDVSCCDSSSHPEPEKQQEEPNQTSASPPEDLLTVPDPGSVTPKGNEKTKIKPKRRRRLKKNKNKQNATLDEEVELPDDDQHDS